MNAKLIMFFHVFNICWIESIDIVPSNKNDENFEVKMSLEYFNFGSNLTLYNSTYFMGRLQHNPNIHSFASKFERWWYVSSISYNVLIENKSLRLI